MTRVRPASKALGDDVTLSRFAKVRSPEQPRLDLPVVRHVNPKLAKRAGVAEGRSLFSRTVATVEAAGNVLVSAHNNVKIGRDVRKGALRGYWIYTLTLEERATCPATCHHWITCYGNHMPYAKRISHRDPAALETAIANEVLGLLAKRGRVGILVRLHALGDFYSPAYVRFWSSLLDAYPRLSVYGYTAHDPAGPIGSAIVDAKVRHGPRFAIRWSNGGFATECAVPVASVDEAVNAIVCPEQTGRTAACATCALCWSTDRNIAFLEH